MSEIEIMWEKFKSSFGVNKGWHDLDPREQHDIILAINVLLTIVNNNKDDK